MLRRPLALTLLALLLLLPAAQAGAVVWTLVKSAGLWVTGTVAAHYAGEVADVLTGKKLKAELEAEMARQIGRVEAAVGSERALREQEMRLLRDQLAAVDRALRGEIEDLREEQARLDARTTDLERRMAAVEGRVDDLEARMAQVEEALIAQCLDLRWAPLFGADGYRVQESGRTHLVDDFESGVVTLALDAHLDACTPELTERGLLLQLSLLTRDLERDLTLYATFKGAGAQGVSNLVRLEYPLSRPGYRLDGQVAEIFIPYAEIPFPSRSERLALALVLLHEGSVIYTLPDQPISCTVAQRTKCRWGR
ncbi:MAG TPA: hypothetical protein VKU40_14630 [Thermoanaerobaculia bacterium]|nr:hypothetical protein [Thermoanaerobaculia bacterium]